MNRKGEVSKVNKKSGEREDRMENLQFEKNGCEGGKVGSLRRDSEISWTS